MPEERDTRCDKWFAASDAVRAERDRWKKESADLAAHYRHRLAIHELQLEELLKAERAEEEACRYVDAEKGSDA